MNVITLRDYAKQNNISYEAVRKQVVRYQKELDGHLIKDGRQQFLDEEAVAFLDARRQKNPVAIIQIEKDEMIEQLKNENKQLLVALTSVQEALLAEKDKTEALLAEKKEEISLLEAELTDKIKTASQEASDAAKRASDEYWCLEVDKVKEEAQKAQERLLKYKEEVAAYNKLPGLRRLFTKAPVLQED